MPWRKVKTFRYWCPLGEECGKKGSYIGDAPSKEVAEERLKQHFSAQENHQQGIYTMEDYESLLPSAQIEEYEKDVWEASPPPPPKRNNGGGAGGAGKGGSARGGRGTLAIPTVIGSRERGSSRRRTRSRSRRRRSRSHHMRVGEQISTEVVVSGSDQVNMPRKCFDKIMELTQMAETNCLDSAKLCAQASTAFSSQATAFNKLRQELLQSMRGQV